MSGEIFWEVREFRHERSERTGGQEGRKIMEYSDGVAGSKKYLIYLMARIILIVNKITSTMKTTR